MPHNRSTSRPGQAARVRGLSPRQHRLWELVRREAEVTFAEVYAFNRRLGAPKQRTTRADLDVFCQAGLLIPHGRDDARRYRPVNGSRR